MYVFQNVISVIYDLLTIILKMPQNVTVQPPALRNGFSFSLVSYYRNTTST